MWEGLTLAKQRHTYTHTAHRRTRFLCILPVSPNQQLANVVSMLMSGEVERVGSGDEGTWRNESIKGGATPSPTSHPLDWPLLPPPQPSPNDICHEYIYDGALKQCGGGSRNRLARGTAQVIDRAKSCGSCLLPSNGAGLGRGLSPPQSGQSEGNQRAGRVYDLG